ncbi:MAG: M48 family metallopeptidase [Cyanobacteria bacterium]|nr:M48 family metallopeptidase [Cyanobacteriota bacterium]MDW8201744.1 M48 family metallopeptidase [Cyanobacteriota bacterium SKYGB_h_bin112]
MPIELPPGTAAHSEDSSPDTSNRQLLVIGGLFLAFVVGLIWLFVTLITNLVLLLPPSVEQQLGAVMVPAFEQQAKSSPTQDTLNQLLDSLEQHLPADKRRDYRVLYIPQDVVNAIAIPGDRVIIYKGLLAEAGSENEVMMVLGHELGHFVNRDHLRGIGRGLAIQLLLAVFLGDAGAIQNVAISGVARISQARFSQAQELKADEVGLTLLAQHYGQVAGATDFFERISRLPGANIAFLSTHPAPRKRVAELRRLIRQRGYAMGTKVPLPPALAVGDK